MFTTACGGGCRVYSLERFKRLHAAAMAAAECPLMTSTTEPARERPSTVKARQQLRGLHTTAATLEATVGWEQQ